MKLKLLLQGTDFTDRIMNVGLRDNLGLNLLSAEVAEWQTRYVQGVVSTRHESSNLSFGTICLGIKSHTKRMSQVLTII